MSEHYLKQELYELVRNDPRIFEFLQAGSLDGIWYWDLEAPEHEWMSPRFWKVLGHSPIGKPHDPAAWQDLIHPEDLELALENFHAHCADPEHPYDQEVRYRAAQGGWVWVRCRGIAIRDAAGTPIRMLGAHSDITSLKRTQEELEAANALARQFLSVASHDLREPARTMAGFAELLQRRYGDQLDAKGQLYLQHVVDGSQRMTGMVEALRLLSDIREQRGRQRSVALEAVVEAVLLDLAAFVEEREAQVQVGELPTVFGDFDQLRTLVQNLVSNALKFHEQGAAPRVSIHSDEDHALVVEDNGIGIPEGAQERVFELFKRAHPEHEGQGIGLALAQRVVDVHRGTLRYEPRAGGGSRFLVDLRRAAPGA